MIQFVCDVCGVVNVREETHDLNHPYMYLWQPVIGPKVKLLVHPEIDEGGEHVCSACLLAGIEALVKAMVNPVPHVDLEAIQDMVDSLPVSGRRMVAKLVDRSAQRNEATPRLNPIDNPGDHGDGQWVVDDSGASPSVTLGGEYESEPTPGPTSPDPDVQPVPTAQEGPGASSDIPTRKLPDGATLRPLPDRAYLYTFYAIHPDGIVYGHEHDKPCPVEGCFYYLTEPDSGSHLLHYCRPIPKS